MATKKSNKVATKDSKKSRKLGKKKDLSKAQTLKGLINLRGIRL